MQTPWRRSILAGLAALSALAAGPALAQSMSANSAAFNAGWNRSSDQENRGVDPSMRDANGNLLVVNGQIMSGSSSFSSGAAGASAGVGFGGSATAIGNNLTVITNGDYNTVVIDSRQTNNGTVTATESTSGSNHGS